MNKQFCAKLGLSQDVKLFTEKFLGFVGAWRRKRKRLAVIISYPNEVEYLVLWACLIWISHMKAIKWWLPFLGRQEEKMSIKLILLERMKQEAFSRCLVETACLSEARPSPLTRALMSSQGHVEGRAATFKPPPVRHPNASQSVPTAPSVATGDG